MEKLWLKGKTYKELYGESFAKERARRISLALKGKHYLTKDGRKSISEALKGRSSPTKGSFWCNNGIEEKMLKSLPDGWTKGRLYSIEKAVRKAQ